MSVDPVLIRVESIAFGGDGVGRHEGKVVFVPFTLPGETVRVRITERHKSYLKGFPEAILEPSQDRERPPCPYYGACGGCRYQHPSYPQELGLKQKQVEEVFRRVGGFSDILFRPIIPSPEPYGYRNRLTVHIEQGRAGFRGADPRKFVPIEKCLLAGEHINRQLGRKSFFSNRGPARLTLRENLEGHGGFQQVNHFLAGTLQALVAEAVLNGRSSSVLIEGYSGDGFFTSRLAEHYQRLFCIEWDSRSVEHARKTLPSHVDIIEAGCEQGLAVAWEKARSAADLPPECLLDPPREGLSKEVRAFLTSCRMSRLIYLSCDPATLARDLRALQDVYSVQYVQPIDMFPRTAEIECLAACSLRSPE